MLYCVSKNSCRYQALRIVEFFSVFCVCLGVLFVCHLPSLPLSLLFGLGSFLWIYYYFLCEVMLKLNKCSFFISQARFPFYSKVWLFNHSCKQVKPQNWLGNGVWQVSCSRWPCCLEWDLQICLPVVYVELGLSWSSFSWGWIAWSWGAGVVPPIQIKLTAKYIFNTVWEVT